ncbi:NADPH:quinone reductase [Chitinophaga sp. CF118]|uniref:zinc-dependent alcohol dehydrogenase family protein n=1 Tax=Chitinophaga sp. CF118 TaxID=1884367 RepID=UPI0008F0F4C3|nr:NAD(P)-dependent alcohol dehydrogenase [Chitinophaga sp. CF118]SFE08099.1 NADPH:quinone reductase [Chitinophaga sp. CF118]
MKSYHIETFGNVNGLIVREHPTPTPGPNEVLVSIKATSLNRRDILILQQTYPLPSKQGVVPISDGTGEVVSTGNNVTKFKKGDRVAGTYFPRWRDGRIGLDIGDQPGCTLDGMLSEFVLLQEDWLVLIPDYLSFEEAATLPCAALTAWSALTSPPISPGNTILTIGSGGVSLFAIQFAKLFGAKVIALTSRDENTGQLKSVGADNVVNYYSNPDWSADVLKLTNGQGVDRVIETGGPDTLEQSIKATAIGGEIALLSYQGKINRNAEMGLNKILAPLFSRLITIKPLFVGNRISFENMNRALSQHHIHPEIDRAFSFEEAKDAYRYFAEGKHTGKVIIKVS